MRMCWGRVLLHLDTQTIRPSGLCLDLKFQSEVVQNSYKWASAGEMKAFSCLSLPKQPCKSRQFLKANEHWIDSKAKSTQQLIFSRRRSARIATAHPTAALFRRARSPSWPWPDWGVGTRRTFPFGAAPCKAAYPQSAHRTPPAAAQCKQRVAFICTETCQAVKFCKPFFANNTDFFKHFQATNNLMPVPSS